ncbi:transporter substrate-binding domain-containing protein [Streptomyces sp. NPDC020141]|uniref:caspase, EACC1-associated type n=1 Tax=Streptomyces sp. NPDC020141 TaxID=3365065 RepID=UPI0037AD8997
MGTSRYQNLEQLPAVSNNLRALAGLLTGPLSLRLPTRHVTVVENSAAERTVVGAVRQAAVEATDTLVVYFAGHGLIDPHGMLSLALPHTEFGRVETGLPYDWLRQVLLQDSRAERHVVILDCCYSGLALGRMSASPDLADEAAVEGSFLLAATAETRTALAPVGDPYTAFTGALIDTLRHGIPGGPALLDLGTVYRHLRLTLAARGHPVPQARDRNSGARVALGRNNAIPPASRAAAAHGAEAAWRSRPDPSPVRAAPVPVPAPWTEPWEYEHSLDPGDAQRDSRRTRMGAGGERVGVPGRPAPAPATDGTDPVAPGGDTVRRAFPGTPDDHSGTAATSQNAGPPRRDAARRAGGSGARSARIGRGPRVALIGTACLALLAGGGLVVWNHLHETRKQPSGAPGASAPSPSFSVSARESALGALNDAKKGKGVLVIGVKDDQPGMSVNQGKGRPKPDWVGAEIEYAKLITRRMKIPEKNIEFYALGTGSREEALEKGFVHMIVGTYGINPERLDRVDFVGPYYQTSQKVMLRKGEGDNEAYFRDGSGVQKSAKVTSIADLRSENPDIPLCTAEKSTSVERLKKLGFTNVSSRTDYSNCMRGLRESYGNGKYKYDGVVTDEPILAGLKKDSDKSGGGAELMITRDGFGTERYGIGLPKGNPTLKRQVCEAMRTVKVREIYREEVTGAPLQAIPDPPECTAPKA